MAVAQTAAATQPDDLTEAGLEARYHALATATAARTGPAQRPATPALPPTDPQARLTPTDIRIPLLAMARASEARSQATILAAQASGGTRALSLSGGAMRLSDVLTAADQTLPDATGPHGLRLPLIIEQDAALLIGPTQKLDLDRSAGAFVANFGTLTVTGGSIRSQGPAPVSAPDFAPFVVTTGQGILAAENAYFEGLGFGHGPSFAGVSVVAKGLYRPATPSILRDTLVRNVRSLTFVGAGAPLVSGTIFTQMRGPSVILQGTQDARIENSVFLGGSGRGTLQITGAAQGTLITGSDIYLPHQSGITIESGSHGTTLHDTLVWRAHHHGVLSDASDCLTLRGLRVVAARHGGAVLRGSRGAAVIDSDFVASGHAGLMVADLPGTAETRIEGNRFQGNRSGLETAAPGHLLLIGNDFSDQFPRFLDGDVEAQTPRLLRDLRGAAPITLAAGGRAQAAPLTRACAPVEGQ